ncbi:MAG: dihydrodipicolinate reductase [Acidobacteria bacterium]|nr:dihydrodipicolinate reductase [Acidobacteriota bacterium]
MKLAIIGYGKMGRMIEGLAPAHGFNVAARLDLGWEPGQLSAASPDVAIEFSTPEAAPANLEAIASLGIPTVCGTTGWFHELGRVSAAVARHESALVYSANYSIGVNIFQRLVADAAALFEKQDAYEAWAWEIHHSAKKDAPSGTLLKLVSEMRKAGYTKPVHESASRAGRHPGTHEIGFDSQADTITLRHTARSREGFAQGALTAARWIIGKRGVHEFSDVLFGGSSCS